jgi:hypothetical protein
VAFIPAVCLAWLGLPVLGARASPATSPGPSAQTVSVSVLDRVAIHKGSHEALYGDVMDYYLETNHPRRTREADSVAHTGRRTEARKTVQRKGARRAADMKRGTFVKNTTKKDEAVVEGVRTSSPTKAVVHSSKFVNGPTGKEKRQQTVDQKKHLESDKNFIKAEMNSAIAIGLVCVLALLYWRFRANPLAEEAWGGIDKNFIPIREADTGETEEQKQFARMEAARTIERAKRKEKEFAERQRGGNDEPIVQVEVQEQRRRVEPLKPQSMIGEIEGDVEIQEAGHSEGVLATEETNLAQGTEEESNAPQKLNSPGLLAMAVLSVMADDIKRELNNMPKHVVPASRVMVCGRVKGAGRTMFARTPRVKVQPSKKTGAGPGSNTGANVVSHEQSSRKSTALDGTDLLLAPVAAALKEISGKRVAPLISDRYNKYNPMYDLHNYVNTLENDNQKQQRSTRDPFIALLDALQSWEGPKAPAALKKYDPTSSIDQIQIDDDEKTYPDPLITFIKAARAFNGPTASERLTKYDPCGQLNKIPVSQRDDGKEYSLLQAMLRAAPEQAEGPDHSFIKALVNAEVDVSPARYDLWKAAMDVKFPEVDAEKIFPIIGDIMTRLRENAEAQIAATSNMIRSQSKPAEHEVAEAERRAHEAEKKALALLERIEQKEDELLSKVQQLKTSLEDDE